MLFTALVENAAKYLVAESIRDEAIGDLWESDYNLMMSEAPTSHRFLRFVWRFLLLIKASAHIYLSENLFSREVQTDLMSCSFDEDIQTNVDSIDTETTEALKTYCNLRQHYNARVSTKILGNRTHINSSLVEKVEDILESPSPFKERGNSGDFIVSRLKLSLLAKRLRDRGGGAQDPRNLDSDYFRGLLEKLQLPKSFLMQYAESNKVKFNRALVFRTRIPSLVSVYVISWEPGQFAPMHHHGYALDGIIVVDGQMTHAQVPPESNVPFEEVCSDKRYEVHSEVFTEGDIVVIPPCHGHQIENASRERLVTVHFRVGFLPRDEYWNPEQEPPFITWDDSSDKTEVLPTKLPIE